MVLSKSKPNKASHMRLKDMRTIHWGRGPASAALWDRGPARDVLGGPALPLLWALGISAVILSLQWFSAWPAPADWGLEQ